MKAEIILGEYGSGGEITVPSFTAFSGITNTNKLTINCNVGDYIIIGAYRSASGINVMWNGVTAHTSPDFISPAVTLAANNFMYLMKASQTVNELYLGSTGATLAGGYTIVSQP